MDNRVQRTEARTRRDRGVTFIEILISVVLLGTVVVVVLAALGASIRGSVKHEEKVATLSVLESAAAGFKGQVEPCTVADYEAAARSVIEDADWVSRLTVVSVMCSDDLDDVRLRAVGPDGLTEVLDVAVGGPRAGDVGGGPVYEDPSAPIVSCAVSSVSAAPTEVALDDASLLTADVLLEVFTDADCSGTLRAVITPPPVNPDPTDGTELRPPLTRVGERQYQVVLNQGTFAWSVGVHDLTLLDENALGTSTAGSLAGFLTTTCAVDASAAPAAPTRQADGRLDGDVTISVTPSPACPDPGSLTFEVNTGVEVYSDVLTLSGSTWTGTIPGQVGVGPVFASGTRAIEISDATSELVATIDLEVQP